VGSGVESTGRMTSHARVSSVVVVALLAVAGGLAAQAAVVVVGYRYRALAGKMFSVFCPLPLPLPLPSVW
jgi:hypothetical protein